nr:unnamed protein product [Callosobruchus chinensis]
MYTTSHRNCQTVRDRRSAKFFQKCRQLQRSCCGSAGWKRSDQL